jgi:hypothetical protein
MNKQDALHLIAAHVAGNMLAGGIEEATGINGPDLDKLSAADQERLGEAMEEVARRLYKMGTTPGDNHVWPWEEGFRAAAVLNSGKEG